MMESTVNDNTPDALQQSIQLEVEQALHQAVTQHSSGNLQVAQELYLAILQVIPTHPDANHNLGILTIQNGQPAASLPYFLAALDANPARGQYWLSYIDALLQAGQTDEAGEILTVARQQGLEGEEVNVLSLRLKIPEPAHPPLTTPSNSAAAKKSKAKPAKPLKHVAAQKKGKYPSAQEINTLFALFDKENFTSTVDHAKKLTERFPSHGLSWKALGTALIHLGRNAEALKPLQNAVKLLPEDIGARNNLGNTLNDLGLFQEAEENYKLLLKIAPAYAEAHSNLGNNLRNQGRLIEAEGSYKRSLELKPDYAEAHNNLGNTLWGLGRFIEAETSFRRALQIKPDFVEAYSNLGNSLRELGKLIEAEISYRQALQLRPTFVEAYNNLAITLKELGRLDEAVASCRRAVELKPDYAEAHSNMGGALREIGKHQEAETCFRRALELKPDFAEPLSNLGGLLRELGQMDEALASCNHALQIDPNYAEAHSNLGAVLKELGRLEEAVMSCHRALEIKPNYSIAHSNLGIALYAQSKFMPAIESYRQALTLKPDFQEARMNLGFAQLSCGQLNEGWQNHEFRISLNKGRHTSPYWAGENLAKKFILISGEQGIGDEIMFASMFAEIITQARRCVIECSPKLVPLFTRSFHGAQVVPKTEPPHPATQSDIDYQIGSGSLAQWLRPTLASFPQKNNFLIADPKRATYWKNRLAEMGHGLKIGINWRSSVKTGERILHYTSLNQWSPIFSTLGVHFINLQYDECSAELNEAQQRFGVPLHIFSEVDMYNDLDETTALIQALDLVICAPTAVSSIAAATGVNTWIMTYGIPWACHGTEHDLWFPSVRYFNRQWNQNWDEIIEHVASLIKLQTENIAIINR